MPVLGFTGKFRWLSNFWAAAVELDGIEYRSVEHAYQAAKTDKPAQRRSIRESDKANDAKHLGQLVDKRPDWEEIKVQVMEDLLRQKFSDKHPQLKEKLLATGDEYLEETNFWSDFFWGVCRGKGQNMLGKLLMKIRDEIRKQINEKKG